MSAGGATGPAGSMRAMGSDASTAAIFGLGLIGGSLTRDLAAAGWRIFAWDADAATVRQAMASGETERALVLDPGDDPPPDLTDSGADLVVLAVPVRAAQPLLRRLAPAVPAHAVVTDVGSTKRTIAAAAAASPVARRFVGSHPMAGDHRSGWAASRRGLFAGARVWLCAEDGVGGDAVDRVASLWRAVGASPERIDAREHDRLIARASHLPQAAASALGAALAAAGVARTTLGPGGRDATRLAGSDPRLWTDILLDNADEVAGALRELRSTLDVMESALRTADAERVSALLERARLWSAGA